MNKQTYLQRKMTALINNREGYQQDLAQIPETLFKNPGVNFIEQQEQYAKRNFESTERLVQIIHSQQDMRRISSSSVLHQLHLIRNRK